MITIPEDQIFAHDAITDGQVRTRDGRTLRLRLLIQRRWGWPRSASDSAAEVLREAAKPNPVVLYFDQERRLKQQASVLQKDPTIFEDLCEGLARGRARADDYHAGIKAKRITIEFSDEVKNFGLIGDIVDSLAQRFGIMVRNDLSIAIFRDDDEVGAVSIMVPRGADD